MSTKRGRKEKEGIDWYAIEREYAQGIFTIDDIAAKFNISNPSIRRRAKMNGWVRGSEMMLGYDPTGKLRDEILAKDILEKNHGQVVKRVSMQLQQQIFAETQAKIESLHSEKLDHLREVSNMLLDKFEKAAKKFDPNDPDRISPAAASSLFTKVVSANKELIELERKVFRIEQSQLSQQQNNGVEIRHINMLDICDPED